MNSYSAAASKLRSKHVSHGWIPSVLALFLVAGPPSAQGMDFSVTHMNPFSKQPDDIESLVLSGPIEPGDYNRLIKFTTTHNVSLLADNVILASPGGDVTEALAIGRLIKGIYATVAVGPAFGPCASACFLIFASSISRVADPGLVGIHRPCVAPERMRTLSLADAEDMQTKALLDAEQYLHQLGVPTGLTDTMFSNASTEIHWLTEDELQNQLGQRAPWYEEMLVARCGLNRSYEQVALSRENDPIAKAWLKNVYDCAAQVTGPEARKYLNKVLLPFGKQVAY